MKKVLIYMALCPQLFAATYYVDATDGNDVNDGLSALNAWKTVGKVNGFTFADGDSIQFQRGETFDDATLSFSPGGGNANLLVRDYGTGTKPTFDGNSNQPINIREAISSVRLLNLNIIGQGWSATKSANVRFANVTNATVSACDFNGFSGWDGTGQGMNALTFEDSVTGVVEVNDCNISSFDESPRWQHNRDYQGITIDRNSVLTSVSIHDNTIWNMGSDAIQIYRSHGPTVNIYSNTIYDTGEQAVDMKTASNCYVYSNTFSTTQDIKDSDSKSFVNLGEFQAGTPPWTYETYNCYVYGNTIDGDFETDAVWFIRSSRDCEIYRNTIQDVNSLGIWFSSFVDDHKVYNNLFINADIYENTTGGGHLIAHNSVYGGRINLDFCGTPASTWTNNIVVETDGSAYPLDHDNLGTDPVFTYNCFHNTASGLRAKFNGSTYTDQATWQAAGHTGGLFADPSYGAPGSGDLTLSAGSPAVDAGTGAGISKDFLEVVRPQGLGHDMGAYELATGRREPTLEILIQIF